MAGLSPRRVRLRSGDFPAADGGVGSGGAAWPISCNASYYRPGVGGGRRHPLRRGAVLEFYMRPLGLVDFAVSAFGAWLAYQAPELYAPDHLRYSMGGGLFALRWVGPLAGDPEDAADGLWAGRCLDMLAAARALIDGGGAELSIEALSPWAFEPETWIEARARGWHEGAFLALDTMAELLCHRASADTATAIPGLLRRSIACAALRPPPDDSGVGGCLGTGAAEVLLEAIAGGVAGFNLPRLALVRELLRGCDVRTTHGAGAWRFVWRQLALVPPLSPRVWACTPEALLHSSSIPATRIGMRLCGDRAHSMVVEGGAAIVHVLGASFVASGTDGACLVAEVVLHAASSDECYITQAGSNLRTLPHSFLGAWQCALGPAGATSAPADGDGHWVNGSATSAFGTDAVVRCGFRMASASSLDGAGAPRMLLHLRTERWGLAGIPVCADNKEEGCLKVGNLAAEEPTQRLLTVCTGVIFNGDARLRVNLGRAGTAPTLLSQWLAYHHVLGVDHFVLYDSDGSVAGPAAPWIAKGSVTYFPRWPESLSSKLGAISKQPHCRHCLSAQAEAHCLWLNRGLSRWVITLHSFDAYLAVAQGHGLRGDEAYFGARVQMPLGTLEPVRASVGTVAVSMIDFGGRPENSSWLIARFIRRVPSVVRVLAEVGRGNPRDECWLNHPGVTLRNPDNVIGVYDHYARSRPGAMDVEVPFELLRVNHYVDTFGERCASRFAACESPDGGVLWALPHMCARLGLAECCMREPCARAEGGKQVCLAIMRGFEACSVNERSRSVPVSSSELSARISG